MLSSIEIFKMKSANRNTNVKTYCKVCHDAGLTEKEYTSHFVKSNVNGVIVCPTLLKQECRYCHKKGHTVKFCLTLKQHNHRQEISANKEISERKNNQNKNEKELNDKKNKKANLYDCLMEDEEEVSLDEVRFEEAESFVSTNKVSYAAALLKPVEKVKPFVKLERKVATTNAKFKDLRFKSWADDDWSSSEEEDEAEDEDDSQW